MKMKLWTIQDERGWNELQSKGILIAKEEFVDPDFKQGYDWLKLQMHARIDYSSIKSQYPIWAWYQSTNAKKRRPDLRAACYLPKGTIGYRIEIEKDPKDVLLSDFELWHVPMFYKYFIADSESEFLKFEQELIKEYGTESYLKLPEHIQQKIEQSWEKIFDMKYDVAYFARPFKEKQIQATFWELNVNEIIKIDQFKAR